jgi:hypothetical protein
MDNLIIFYSKVVALAHQDSVLGYAVKSDYIFIEKILESYSNLNMLLDHRFPRDTELAHAVRKLTKTAIEYFNTCMLSHDSSNHESEYKEFYQTTIPDIDRLCNIIIGVEWTRIKKEAEKGLPIPAERWQKQYEEDAVYYDKWNEQYG